MGYFAVFATAMLVLSHYARNFVKIGTRIEKFVFEAKVLMPPLTIVQEEYVSGG